MVPSAALGGYHLFFCEKDGVVNKSLPQNFQNTLSKTRILHLVFVGSAFLYVLIVEMMRAWSLLPIIDLNDSAIGLFVLLESSAAVAWFFINLWRPELFLKLKNAVSQELGLVFVTQLMRRSLVLTAFAQAPSVGGLVVALTTDNFLLFYSLTGVTLILHFLAFPRAQKWEELYSLWLENFKQHRIRGN